MPHELMHKPRNPPSRPCCLSNLGDEGGFTIIEAAVAAVIVAVALGALLGLLAVGSRATTVTRLRQAETSYAREITENLRNLPYNELTASTLASTLQPLIPNSTVSFSGALKATRTPTAAATPYTLRATFTACSLDDPSDGYGNHSTDPPSGGSWCPDVAASGTTDTNPDDYKRVSVVVTPSRTRTTPAVQETVLVYNRPVNGPAVSCLTASGSCPGVNRTITTGSSLQFTVTTTTTPAAIQWLVNGSPPTSDAIPSGAKDPYVPTSTTSTFTWNFPTADGTYTIAARSFDNSGNAGTESKLQVTLNRHQVIAPATAYAGWNPLLGTSGGVDVQWVPSVDQDVLYYNVYHQYGTTGAAILACSHVTGTSCSDQAATSPNPPSTPTCTNPPQSYSTQDLYWVVGVDSDPTTGLPRESTAKSPSVDANLCNHQPNPPTGLTGTVSSDAVTLNWTPPSPADPDAGDSIQGYRIYRWSTTGSWSDPGGRLDLVGAVDTSGNPVTSYADNSPDPGGVQQNYCVTAIDSQQAESPCSGTVTG